MPKHRVTLNDRGIVPEYTVIVDDRDSGRVPEEKQPSATFVLRQTVATVKDVYRPHKPSNATCD